MTRDKIVDPIIGMYCIVWKEQTIPLFPYTIGDRGKIINKIKNLYMVEQYQVVPPYASFDVIQFVPEEVLLNDKKSTVVTTKYRWIRECEYVLQLHDEHDKKRLADYSEYEFPSEIVEPQRTLQ